MSLFGAKKEPEGPPKPNPHEAQFPAAEWVYAGLIGGNRITYREMLCCGVKELYGIQSKHAYKNRVSAAYQNIPVTAEEFLRKALDFIRGMDRHRPFWIYTVAGDYVIGDHVKKIIEKNNLGPVFVSEPAHNYNSGNLVRVYLWTVPEIVRKVDLEKVNYDVGT